MTESKPTIVLVHGAFAESASWNGVIERLARESFDVVAVPNLLRSVAGDSAYVRDAIAAIGGPVLLVGHSYAGIVITEAAAANDAVVGLVYVNAFAPDHGESALSLSGSAPGSTLGEALAPYPSADGGTELVIRRDLFHHQFAADVPADIAALMAATQRPIAQSALSEGLPTKTPAWKTTGSWFVFGDQDLNIPVAVHRAGASRAGALGVTELAGASHAISVSQADAVAAVIAEAARQVAAKVS